MHNPQVILHAVPWCARCHRVRRFLDAAGREYREVNPEQDPEAAERLAAATGGAMDVPAVEVGGRFLLDPSDEDLAAALGEPVPEGLDVFDVVVVGGGPAGLTAAIYTARERLRTLVLEKALPGGQAALTGQIENYPGFPDPVGGAELMDRVHRQAQRFGAEIRTFEEASALRSQAGLLAVEAGEGTYRARTVILATGSVYRRMGVPGEETLIGRGVSFCATCDAPFFRGKHVVVVGGGNSALQVTVHLAEFASHITLIQGAGSRPGPGGNPTPPPRPAGVGRRRGRSGGSGRPGPGRRPAHPLRRRLRLHRPRAQQRLPPRGRGFG